MYCRMKRILQVFVAVEPLTFERKTLPLQGSEYQLTCSSCPEPFLLKQRSFHHELGLILM